MTLASRRIAEAEDAKERMVDRKSRSSRARPSAFAALGVTIGITTLAAAPCAARDLEPTTEQVTERTRSFASLWNALRERTAGLRVRVDEQLLSSGEFNGARTWWLRSGLAVEAGAPLTESVSLGVSPSFAWERLVIEGDDDLVVAQSGRDTQLVDFFDSGLRVGASYRPSESWGIEAVTGFSARQEQGARYDDAAQAGGSVALQLRRGGWLRLRIGLGIGADLGERGVRFSPVYRVVLQPLAGWTFEASGLGGSIEWDVTRRTRLALSGGVEGSRYKLDRRRDPPGGPGDGIIQRRQAQMELELRHQLDERWRLQGGLGLVLDEELTILDEDGFEVEQLRERDPSMILRLGVEIRI